MNTPPGSRPDPDALLSALQKREQDAHKGKLKIFLGMCAGVGKTYEMLTSARAAQAKGVDVVIGVVETHGRAETEALLAGLPVIPRARSTHGGATIEEMDLDAILARAPQLALVDELAHSNAPDSRHTKRYNDVLELLEHGIDVYTTLNVQHLESRADTVAQITGNMVRETVPDSIFEAAHEVEVIDLPPDELLQRLAEGKVYAAEQSQRAAEHFFRKGNLTALRELSLRLAAERVEHQLRDYMQTNRIAGPWKTSERLIIGISPSPASVRLIRWARRMAFTMQASWIGVFVERAQPLLPAERAQLAANIALARELGAEILTTADENVADALIRVAREQNATQILIGKPEGSNRSQRGMLDRLLAQCGELDVHVVGGQKDARPHRRPFALPRPHSRPRDYGIAPAITLAAASVCAPFHDVLGYQTVAMILLLIVSLLPLRFGVGPVLLSAGVSAMVWNYFFIPPRFTFAIGEFQDVLMFVAYFAIAAVSSVLTVRVRARERALRSREERAMALYALTHDLSRAHSPDDVVHAAVRHISAFFDADVAVFLSELDGDFLGTPHAASAFLPDEKEASVPSWVHWNEKRAGKHTDTLPFAGATYYPMPGPRYALGVIGTRLRDAAPLSIDQDALLENFISQIALAIDREFLNELSKRTVVLAESERLYTTLFNSVSHEMRTPITALIGTAEGLLDDAIGGRPDVRRHLASEVHAAADRLDAIVQNLLAMTRIESGLIAPILDWCDVNDLVNAARGRLQNELAPHPFATRLPADLPLLMVDFGLIEQALVNLLRNAAMYTPAGAAITARAWVEQTSCVVAIEDEGPGIPPDAMERLFDKFYRVPGSVTGGIGLGLSIAQGFAEAHRGSLSVENIPSGGARFLLRLPLAPERPAPAGDAHG
ncbi:MAG: sensor histidine kinase KdpD [Ignavibacteria bacterium]|nr:sensor histidine kinase KdpD [Ignavibacteria bacterium]